jgi:hypothetical protein
MLICLSIMIFNFTASGQYSNKKVRPEYQAYTDSIKNHEYNYVFPIFGQKTYRKGFDIPYPAGIMGNFMWSEVQSILSTTLPSNFDCVKATIGSNDNIPIKINIPFMV